MATPKTNTDANIIREVPELTDQGSEISRSSNLADIAAHWQFDVREKGTLTYDDERTDLSRNEIIDLTSAPTQEALPILLRVIASEVSENKRESAIKALAGHGGEYVCTLLESIYAGHETSKFGQGAAKKALKQLGLTRDDEPVFNPNNLQRAFLTLCASRDRTEIPFRGSNNFAEVQNIESLTSALVGFSIFDAQITRLETKMSFDVQKAEQVCKQAGLETRLLGDNALEVSGNTWPGFGQTQPELQLVFWVKSRSQKSPVLRIFASQIPASTGCDSWRSASRLLMRLASWSGG